MGDINWANFILAALLGMLGSSGLWAFIMSVRKTSDATTQLLLGLAHDRIISLGMSFIERGWITKDEYQDYDKYLWKPYSTFGGNGLAEKIADAVSRLPILTRAPQNWKPETTYEKPHPPVRELIRSDTPTLPDE